MFERVRSGSVPANPPGPDRPSSEELARRGEEKQTLEKQLHELLTSGPAFSDPSIRYLESAIQDLDPYRAEKENENQKVVEAEREQHITNAWTPALKTFKARQVLVTSDHLTLTDHVNLSTELVSMN